MVVVQGEDYDTRMVLYSDMRKQVEIAQSYATAQTGKASFASGMADFDGFVDKTISDTIKRADEAMYLNKIEMKK